MSPSVPRPDLWLWQDKASGPDHRGIEISSLEISIPRWSGPDALSCQSQRSGRGTLGLIRHKWLASKQYASTQALDVQLARLLPFTAVRAIRIIEPLEAQTCV